MNNKYQQYQCSKKEQIALYTKWCETHDSLYKQKLLMSFMPMVIKIASNLKHKYYIHDIEDMIHHGYIVIDSLLPKYNKKRADLSTFFYLVVKRELYKYIKEQQKHTHEEIPCNI